MKWHFSTLEVDDRGLNETRANACEIVAWRFLSRISERDAVDYCLYELPAEDGGVVDGLDGPSESTSLLPQFRIRDSAPIKKDDLLRSVSHSGGMFSQGDNADDEEEYVFPKSEAREVLMRLQRGPNFFVHRSQWSRNCCCRRLQEISESKNCTKDCPWDLEWGYHFLGNLERKYPEEASVL